MPSQHDGSDDDFFEDEEERKTETKGKAKATGRKKDPESLASRKTQNRIAQREFRQRKQQYIKELETRVEVLSANTDDRYDHLRDVMRALMNENTQLRSMVSSMGAFLGEGLGSVLPRMGLSDSLYHEIIDKGHNDVALDAFVKSKERLQGHVGPSQDPTLAFGLTSQGGVGSSTTGFGYPAGGEAMPTSKYSGGLVGPLKNKRKRTIDSEDPAPNPPSSTRKGPSRSNGQPAMEQQDQVAQPPTLSATAPSQAGNSSSSMPHLGANNGRRSATPEPRTLSSLPDHLTGPDFSSYASSNYPPSLEALNPLNAFTCPPPVGMPQQQQQQQQPQSRGMSESSSGSSEGGGISDQFSGSPAVMHGGLGTGTGPLTPPSAGGVDGVPPLRMKEPGETSLEYFEDPKVRAAVESQPSSKQVALQLISYHLTNARANPSYHLPPSLVPTILQRTVPHDPMIDGVVFPRVRDRMIICRDRFDLAAAMHSLFNNFTIHGEDCLAVEAWEVSETFMRSFPMLIEPELVACSNRWRLERGLRAITLEELTSS